MGQGDWTKLSDGLVTDGPVIDRTAVAGVTQGLDLPRGASGPFVYAMRSLTNAVGVVGLRATPGAPNTDFDPLLLGGTISSALRRQGPCSTFVYVGLQGTAVGADAYMLGLSEANPSHIALRKGALSVGLPDEAPGNVNRVLRRSTRTFGPKAWVHLQLETINNPNGDVVLRCSYSDLEARSVDAPVWIPIPGIEEIVIDDLASINTGSAPLLGGRLGYAARFSAAGGVALFKDVVLAKQTA